MILSHRGIHSVPNISLCRLHIHAVLLRPQGLGVQLVQILQFQAAGAAAAQVQGTLADSRACGQVAAALLEVAPREKEKLMDRIMLFQDYIYGKRSFGVIIR